MLELLKRLAKGYCNLLNENAQAATEAWDDQDWRCFFKNIGLLLLFLTDGAGVIALLVLILWKNRGFLIALITPVFLLALLIASFYENQKKPGASNKTSTVSEVRTKAYEVYSELEGGMLRVLQKLCEYDSSFILPHNTSQIKKKPYFYITKNLAVIYHFIIYKNESGISVDGIESILNSVIAQHLEAYDFPVSETYQAEDGSIWPGLALAGIHLGGKETKYYRVDVCVMGEAEVNYWESKGDGVVKPLAPSDPDLG